ncbi:MAG: hypothetical protein AVDCRST_MAG65-2188, partial [uncultured Solirubrobacteraceae bacterium]
WTSRSRRRRPMPSTRRVARSVSERP